MVFLCVLQAWSTAQAEDRCRGADNYDDCRSKWHEITPPASEAGVERTSRQRRYSAAAPYEYYPNEYYILRGHPSQYYYTYPDRYYARPYRHASPRYQYDRDAANPWSEEYYGYHGPCRRPSGQGELYGDRYWDPGSNWYQKHRERYRTFHRMK